MQTNNGERDPNANIVGSWNCDFSGKPGRVFPSLPLAPYVREDDDDTVEVVTAFASWDNGSTGPFWAASANGNIWEGGTVGGMTVDASTGTPTTDISSDMVVFDGKLLCSEGTTDDIAMMAATTWDADWYTTRSGAGTLGSGPFPLEVIRVGSPLLAIGDGNKIHTVTSGTGVATHDRLTLDGEFITTWIRSGTSKAFIGGVMSKQGNRVVVYEWDGGDTVPTRQYQIETTGVLSATVVDDELYVLTFEMEIKRLSGSRFVTVASFPIAHTRKEIWSYTDASFEYRVVAPRGMASINNKILINVSNLLQTTTVGDASYTPYYPSGVWEFDINTNSLTHKQSYCLLNPAEHDFGQWTTPANEDASPGAILPVVDPDMDASVFVSGGVFTTGTASPTVLNTIYCDKYLGRERRCRVWTNHIFTDDTASFFQKVALKYYPMADTTEKILIKYRTSMEAALPRLYDIEWASATTFLADALTSVLPGYIGYEVFVYAGLGGGCSSHIVSVTPNYSGAKSLVTLDEPIVGYTSGSTARVAIENWKKLASFNDTIGSYKEFTLPVSATTWIQLLIEMRGKGTYDSPVLEEIDIIPTKQQ